MVQFNGCCTPGATLDEVVAANLTVTTGCAVSARASRPSAEEARASQQGRIGPGRDMLFLISLKRGYERHREDMRQREALTREEEREREVLEKAECYLSPFKNL